MTDRQRLVNMEYHALPMRYLHQVRAEDLRKALHERPEATFRALLQQRLGSVDPVEVTWDALFPLLADLEAEMAAILSTRSVMFWLHLYRRIAPQGLDNTGAPLDATTVSIMRDLAEAAIQKHGALDGRWEFGIANTVDPACVLGGWLRTTIEACVEDDARRRAMERALLSNAAFVLMDFEAEDLEKIYEVEGLAYRYWQVTAKLRALGKGARIALLPDATLVYDDATTPWALMRSYDERARKHSLFDGSALGIWVGADRTVGERGGVFMFAPNAGNQKVSDLMKAAGGFAALSSDGHDANYLPGMFDAMAFCDRHAHVAAAFEKRKGYSLRALASVFRCMSERLVTLIPTDAKVGLSQRQIAAFSFFNLCQRAYAVKHRDVYDEVVAACRGAVATDCALSETDASDQVERIVRAITLAEDRRDIIGLWSRGPRFPIIRIPDGYVFDFYGIHRYFHHLFVGVREENSDRGYAFEDVFRAELEAAGFELECRNYKFMDGTRAEADAVFYIGSRLVVVDCLSVWMPLDFDISRPATMAGRRKAIDEKVDASLARVEKLRANRVGRNFDISPATEVIALVATPFTEWLWDRSERLWYQADAPRVMRANELIEWAKAQRSARLASEHSAA